ncbi:MAG: PASTA domain-containing protein [Elusimicrobiota bacterium]
MHIKRKLKITAWVIVGIIVSFIVWNFFVGVIVHIKKEVVVPNLTNHDLITSSNVLKKQRLKIKIEGERFESKILPGIIIDQSPPAGSKVRQGKVIRVVISKGIEQVNVPEVLGKELRVAEIEIENSALFVGQESYEYSLYIDKDIVMDQDPNPGELVEKGYFINLIVSKGLPPDDVILMPMFVGKNIDMVNEECGRKGYKVNITGQASDSEGIVLEQFPKPDTVLNGNNILVNLVVSALVEEKINTETIEEEVK